MNIECAECGRMFRKRKNSENEVLQDVCKKCIEVELRKLDLYEVFYDD